jgi:hypothetical protein
MPGVTDLKGLWRRSMIAWPDGRCDTTTRVGWLQGLSTYIDLRQPTSMPDFSAVRFLNDLSVSDCAALATQEGFAGHLNFDGRHFEWLRQIDFQPASPFADAGSLEWEAQVLVERGRDVGYVEHWHRDAATGTDPCGAAVLREVDQGTKSVLLRVGATFMFARDRTMSLPAHRTLSASIAAAPTVGLARALIDCEISRGVVTPEGFQITTSTLPYRVGAVLGQDVLHDTITTRDRGADGAAVGRVWDIIECEGDLGALALDSRRSI